MLWVLDRFSVRKILWGQADELVDELRASLARRGAYIRCRNVRVLQNPGPISPFRMLSPEQVRAVAEVMEMKTFNKVRDTPRTSVRR